jgi:hypothetical protein
MKTENNTTKQFWARFQIEKKTDAQVGRLHIFLVLMQKKLNRILHGKHPWDSEFQNFHSMHVHM